MGIYINPGNNGFRMSINSEIYVDKTELIEYTNAAIDTENRFICISRPRRFGKSITARMLTAYYGKDCDSSELFAGFKIAENTLYKNYLNKYDVLFLNMQQFLSEVSSKEDFVKYIQSELIEDLKEYYSDMVTENDVLLTKTLEKIYRKKNSGFVFIIDEWDCIFREYKDDKEIQIQYLDFLRNVFKDRDYVSLVYMTGILPIKKYGTHSALNMFSEYSMTDMSAFDRFTGFTEDEIRELCNRYSVDYTEMKRWYDGYLLDDYHVYNPKSVVDAITRKKFSSYWTKTETYEALKIYIDMNFDSLKDDIIKMLGGLRCKINTLKFQNDMTTFTSKDDVLTILVHLGYLAFDSSTSEVFIPNDEIRAEFVNVIESVQWDSIIKIISDSDKLVEATLNGDEATVAEYIDAVHSDNTSILSYNDENSLSCVITLAYFSAGKDYMLVREMPAGKGFADIVFLPRRNADKPAMIIELKWDKSADGAVEQIKNKKYINALKDYDGEVLLVGINYDKATKKHSCVIEKSGVNKARI